MTDNEKGAASSYDFYELCIDDILHDPEVSKVLREAVIYQELFREKGSAIRPEEIDAALKDLNAAWPLHNASVKVTGIIDAWSFNEANNSGSTTEGHSFDTKQVNEVEMVSEGFIANDGSETNDTEIRLQFTQAAHSDDRGVLEVQTVYRSFARPDAVSLTDNIPSSRQAFAQAQYYVPEAVERFQQSLFNADDSSDWRQLLSSHVYDLDSSLKDGYEAFVHYINSHFTVRDPHGLPNIISFSDSVITVLVDNSASLARINQGMATYAHLNYLVLRPQCDISDSNEVLTDTSVVEWKVNASILRHDGEWDVIECPLRSLQDVQSIPRTFNTNTTSDH